MRPNQAFGTSEHESSWASVRDKNRGKAEVWIDGEKEATVDLYSPSAEARQAVFSKGRLSDPHCSGYSRCHLPKARAAFVARKPV